MFSPFPAGTVNVILKVNLKKLAFGPLAIHFIKVVYQLIADQDDPIAMLAAVPGGDWRVGAWVGESPGRIGGVEIKNSFETRTIWVDFVNKAK